MWILRACSSSFGWIGARGVVCFAAGDLGIPSRALFLVGLVVFGSVARDWLLFVFGDVWAGGTEADRRDLVFADGIGEEIFALVEAGRGRAGVSGGRSR